MKQNFISIVVNIIIILSGLSCKDSTSPKQEQSETVKEEIGEGTEKGKIFIVDRTGERWDITHAVKRYKMPAEYFQFGLGRNVIQPILNPQMLHPGDSGYPDDSAKRIILGTTIEGDSRAYPLEVLSKHEIANEEFEGVYAAVAY